MKARDYRHVLFRTPKPLDPVCPNCGPGTEFAEVDTLLATARITGFTADGNPVFEGTTDLDWDSQKPAHDPPRFECNGCWFSFPAAAIAVPPALTAPGEFG